MSNTPPPSNGWTQYQKLVLAELERHDSQMENIKKDIVEIKLAQRELSSEMIALQNSITELNNTLKEHAVERKAADKEAVKQKIDLNGLKLRFGFLCAVIGIVSGAGGRSLVEFIKHMLGN